MNAATRCGPSSRIFVLERARDVQPEFGRTQVAALGIPVRLADVHDVRDRQAALLVHETHAAEARAGHGAAVVGILPADDDLALGLAEQVPVAAHQAHDRVVAFRARAREEHAVELRRRQVDQLPGQFDRGRMGRLEEAVVVRQLEHLPVRRLREFTPSVAEVDAPETRHAVEDPVAVGVVEVDAVRLDDDARSLRRAGSCNR